MKDPLEFRVLQLTSGHFLTKSIPNNWYELSLEEQNNFLNENVWQPLEELDTSFIWETIEASAEITYNFINELQRENK